jgi:hypothetical protein
MVHWTENINKKVANSIVGRHFHLEGSGVKNERTGSKFLTEIRAGITTFSAMVYIIRYVMRSLMVRRVVPVKLILHINQCKRHHYLSNWWGLCLRKHRRRSYLPQSVF